MKASKMHPAMSGKNLRMNFSQRAEIGNMPNLIDIQQQSYVWFITRGLTEVFKDVFPIEDPTGKIKLEFVSVKLRNEDTKYDREECKQRNATYAFPLYARFRLVKKEKNEVVEHEIYMSDLPAMTPNGSFIINGAERVVVSQMVRSPGIYYEMNRDKIGNKLYSSTLIPNRGAWIEYDSDANDIMWARVDRTRKVPITVFLRALGLSTDDDIIDLFGEEKYLRASMEKEPEDERNHDRGIIELYRKIRPGEQLSVEACESLFKNSLFDPKRYDLGRAGRYKYNKKLHFKYRLLGQVLAKDAVDELSGEVYKKGTKIDEEIATNLQNAAVPFVYIKVEGEDEPQKILSSMMVDINSYVRGVKDEEWDSMGISELVYYPVLREILDENKKNKGGKDALLETIADRALELVPKHVTREDIFASINYFCHLSKGIGNTDDIDHLGNRRIRAVGELLQNQYRMGLSRLERVVREKMVAVQVDEMTIQALINTKPVSAVIKEFFGSSQLSQFMDQNNPLSEL